MSDSRYATELQAIKELSKERVYASPNVLQIEAAGFEVLGGLLGRVVPAIVKQGGMQTAAEKKVLELVPLQFMAGATTYERLLGAADFVSGMTDSFALTLYRRFLGIELPRG